MVSLTLSDMRFSWARSGERDDVGAVKPERGIRRQEPGILVDGVGGAEAVEWSRW
jgi:hypothetical protein